MDLGHRERGYFLAFSGFSYGSQSLGNLLTIKIKRLQISLDGI